MKHMNNVSGTSPGWLLDKLGMMPTKSIWSSATDNLGTRYMLNYTILRLLVLKFIFVGEWALD